MSAGAYPSAGVPPAGIDPDDSVAETLEVVSLLEEASLEIVVLIKVEVFTPGSSAT